MCNDHNGLSLAALYEGTLASDGLTSDEILGTLNPLGHSIQTGRLHCARAVLAREFTVKGDMPIFLDVVGIPCHHMICPMLQLLDSERGNCALQCNMQGSCPFNGCNALGIMCRNIDFHKEAKEEYHDALRILVDMKMDTGVKGTDGLLASELLKSWSSDCDTCGDLARGMEMALEEQIFMAAFLARHPRLEKESVIVLLRDDVFDEILIPLLKSHFPRLQTKKIWAMMVFHNCSAQPGRQHFECALLALGPCLGAL